jgi:hypothetical protein
MKTTATYLSSAQHLLETLDEQVDSFEEGLNIIGQITIQLALAVQHLALRGLELQQLINEEKEENETN